MFETEYLWPEPGRTFFQSTRTRPDAYTWNCASLGEYAYMYRESAEKLIELACNAPGLLNVHAIPAVYLFRHSVELSLKDMLVDAGILNNGPGSFREVHGLLNLWRELRKLMTTAGLGKSEDLTVVESMIHELDVADPDSMSFRYPCDRQAAGGQRLLSAAFEYFDMRAFRDQAQRLSNFIDGCGTQLSEYVRIMREMESEYAPE